MYSANGKLDFEKSKVMIVVRSKSSSALILSSNINEHFLSRSQDHEPLHG